MQIKPKLSPRPDVTGEFDITDYALGFDEHGPLRHLNIHWNAIVHFCKTLGRCAGSIEAGDLARTVQRFARGSRGMFHSRGRD
jgi:hypothetical protein